jgi:hypothetical protein
MTGKYKKIVDGKIGDEKGKGSGLNAKTRKPTHPFFVRTTSLPD